MTSRLAGKFIKGTKLLTPPILWRILRRIGDISDRQNVFEGIFEHLEQVNATGYDSEESLNEIYELTKRKLVLYADKKELPESSPLSPVANLLPLLIATLGQREKAISILDFGGGMGASYIDCLHSLSTSGIELEYHVVDLSRTIERGRKVFPSNYNIHFYHQIPPDLQNVDVVYLGSSLEYISDYKSLIIHLMKLSPRYVFITDNFMGKMSTFATAQVNMKDRKMAYWIFQLDEIIELVTRQNYALIYRSVNYQPFHHFDNFPAEYRVRDSCNLLFSSMEACESESIDKHALRKGRNSQPAFQSVDNQ